MWNYVDPIKDTTPQINIEIKKITLRKINLPLEIDFKNNTIVSAVTMTIPKIER